MQLAHIAPPFTFVTITEQSRLRLQTVNYAGVFKQNNLCVYGRSLPFQDLRINFQDSWSLIRSTNAKHLHHSYTVNVGRFGTSGTLLHLKLGSNLFLHLNVRRPRTFDVQSWCSRQSLNVLKHSTTLKTQ